MVRSAKLYYKHAIAYQSDFRRARKVQCTQEQEDV